MLKISEKVMPAHPLWAPKNHHKECLPKGFLEYRTALKKKKGNKKKNKTKNLQPAQMNLILTFSYQLLINICPSLSNFLSSRLYIPDIYH